MNIMFYVTGKEKKKKNTWILNILLPQMNTKTFCLNLLIDNPVQPLSRGAGGLTQPSAATYRWVLAAPASLLAGPAAECVRWEKFLREYRRILSSL